MKTRLNSILLFITTGIFCCDNHIGKRSSDSKSSGNTSEVIGACSTNYDSTLIRMADEFLPKSIDLSQSLPDEMSKFLSSIDTTCFRKQKNSPLFISVVLSKLYLYHLKCCGQGYDLQSMRGPGSFIVFEFKRLLKVPSSTRLEFLNSFRIVNYIKSVPELTIDARLTPILEEIEREEDRRNNK